MNEISRVLPEHFAKISDIVRDHPQIKTGALVLAGILGTYVSFLALIEPEESIEIHRSRMRLEGRLPRSNASSQASKTKTIQNSRTRENNSSSKWKFSVWNLGGIFGTKSDNSSLKSRNSVNSHVSQNSKRRSTRKIENRPENNPILTPEKTPIQEFPKEELKESEVETHRTEEEIAEAYIAEQRALQDKIKQLLTKIERQTYEIDCLSKTAQLYEGQFRAESHLRSEAEENLRLLRNEHDKQVKNLEAHITKEKKRADQLKDTVSILETKLDHTNKESEKDIVTISKSLELASSPSLHKISSFNELYSQGRRNAQNDIMNSPNPNLLIFGNN